MNINKLLFFFAGLMFFSWLAPQFSFSQDKDQSAESKVKFGQVSLEELEMKVYNKDSAAAAVMLFEKGNTYFILDTYHGFRIRHEYHGRIKILKKSGLDLANQVIPLYHSPVIGKGAGEEEKVVNLKGFVYYLEGGKIVKHKLEPSHIFEENIDQHLALKKIAFPQVREGAVIDYSYQIVSDFWGQLREWHFQRSIPVQWSEYTARIPEYFNYRLNQQGYNKFYISDNTPGKESFPYSYTPGSKLNGDNFDEPTRYNSQSVTLNAKNQLYRWVMNDVPAFREENFTTTPEDYLAKVEFQLESYHFPWLALPQPYSDDWKRINDQLLAMPFFGGVATQKVLKEIPALFTQTEAAKEPEQKMKLIYNYLKSNISCNKKNTIYSAIPLKELLSTKTGSVGDINLLLVALLREAGIEACPVVLSTREHGKTRNWYPSVSQLNYVVAQAKIGEKYYMLDATDKDLPAGLLPSRCLAETGWKVHEKEGDWIVIQNQVKTAQTLLATLRVDENGALSGNLQRKQEGYFALQSRQLLSKEGEEKYFKADFKTENSGISIANFAVENAKEASLPLKTSCEITSPEYAQVAGDRIYINPLLPQVIKENVFKNPERQFPVDFNYPLQETYLLTLNLPEGYQVESLPAGKSVGLADKGLDFNYSAAVADHKVQLTMKFSINRPVLAVAEYPALQEFYMQMIAQQTEQIVLKKK